MLHMGLKTAKPILSEDVCMCIYAYMHVCIYVYIYIFSYELCFLLITVSVYRAVCDCFEEQLAC